MSVSEHTSDRPPAALTLSQAEAAAVVLAAAVAVDGVLGTEEERRLKDVLATTRWALGLSEAAVDGAAKRGFDLIAAHGLPAVLKASADALAPDMRATIFALAVDLVLADGRLGSRENAFIDQMQTALQIQEALARKIVDVLLIKNRASGRPDV
jgi:uncharacterized tellurite resistance protein B-like protein